ncbi:hypothetical protein RAS1_34570 [Phycisphaerae bacterium RAS1]|nr:hypothetical protein RAS1_34570 [Phycisphaerae bacterium RAS1]
MTRCFTNILFASIALLALGAPAARGDATVALTAEGAEAYVGEPFSIVLRIDRFQSCDDPQFPEIPGCRVQQSGEPRESFSQLTINGRTTRTVSRAYQYLLTPERHGELVIPSVLVRVDGVERKTRPITIKVLPSDSEQLFWAEISCRHERLYLGQKTALTLTLWVKPIETDNGLIPANRMSRFISGSLGPFPNQPVINQQVVTLPGGERQRYFTYEMTAEYVPEKAGTLVFDEIDLAMRYPTQLALDIFGELQASSYRNLRIRPRVRDVEVLPLPEAGRPANFTGAVGTFSISVRARPLSVRVGDPIELTIDVTGDGPLESLAPPRLAADAKLTSGFRVPKEDLAGERLGGGKRFTQTIRAERSDVTEIPPIEYPYFDPERERYVVAISNPIAIRVQPSDELTAAEIGGLPAPTDQPPAAVEAVDGLRGNVLGEAELLNTVSVVTPQEVIAVTITPPAVFLAAWCGSAIQRRRGGAAQRRRAQAARNALSRIDRAAGLPRRERAGQIEAALAGYLADRLDAPAPRFHGRAALPELAARGASEEVRRAWDAVVQQCEQAGYGGGADASAEGATDPGGGASATVALVADARRCIALLERERLS